MGVVYKARDERLDRLVAIKVVRKKVLADPERQARFIQEAKAGVRAEPSKHRNDP